MKAKARLVIAGLLAVVLTGCVTVVPGAEITERGTIVFWAQGQSIVAKEDDPFSRLEAEMAAAAVAKANLLAKVKGELITGNVQVGDLMLKSQEVAVMVEGFLGRANIEIVDAGLTRMPKPVVVTAIAALEMAPADLARLGEYAQ
ncbi:MAG: hypothetical protein ACYTFZ_04100 [Planctomycetota bacterium]|jgi:hypothetical protein